RQDSAVPNEGNDASGQGCLNGECYEPAHGVEGGGLKRDGDREDAEQDSKAADDRPDRDRAAGEPAATAPRSAWMRSGRRGRFCQCGCRGSRHTVPPGPPVEGLASLARELKRPTLAGSSPRPLLIRSLELFRHPGRVNRGRFLHLASRRIVRFFPNRRESFMNSVRLRIMTWIPEAERSPWTRRASGPSPPTCA